MSTDSSDERRQHLPDAHAARAHRDELVLTGEEPEPDQSAGKDGQRRHLRDDERHLVQEQPHDGSRGRVVLEEAVEAIEEVGEQVDRR